ncbi:hypothetical protein HZS_7175 [Henneguya salminicola]|nr:hypothetical protein HZS_7175 [Henneguya salminicola]
MDFREMDLVIYGQKKIGASHDQYFIRVTMNKDTEICKSSIAFRDGEFRTDDTLTDYLEESEHKDLFSENLILKIEILDRHDDDFIILLFDGSVVLFPNDEKTFTALENDVLAVKYLQLKLSCHGFTGYNCQFKNKDTNKVMTDFKTGFEVCKKAEECMPVEEECENNHCANGGTCYIDHISREPYCVCLEGFGGITCSYDECAFDEEELLYGEKEQFCESFKCSSEENPCKNNGKIQLTTKIGNCTRYGSRFYHCKCPASKYTGKYCEEQCSSDCPNDSYCTNDNDGEGPYCYPSLKNPVIETKVLESPILCEPRKFYEPMTFGIFLIITIFQSLYIAKINLFPKCRENILVKNFRTKSERNETKCLKHKIQQFPICKIN